MTTPDGRDGWNDYFLGKGYSTYLVDQPRRGEAGQTSVASEIPTAPQELAWFTQFRMGRWPLFNDGTQFPQDAESIDQFFRQMTPDTGAIDFDVITDAMVDVFERSGKGILVTHSQGRFPGWTTAAASDAVEAVIAIEPGACPFPEDILFPFRRSKRLQAKKPLGILDSNSLKSAVSSPASTALLLQSYSFTPESSPSMDEGNLTIQSSPSIFTFTFGLAPPDEPP